MSLLSVYNEKANILNVVGIFKCRFMSLIPLLTDKDYMDMMGEKLDYILDFGKKDIAIKVLSKNG